MIPYAAAVRRLVHAGPGGRHGDQGDDAHHDTKGIGRDDVAGRGNRDADPSGDLWEQTHGDELGCADGESTDRERNYREFDVSAGCRRLKISVIPVLHDGGLGH